MDGDVGVDGRFFLQSRHSQGVSNASRSRVELVVFEGDDFPHPQSRINAQGEEGLVAAVAQYTEEIADLVLSEDSGLTRHMNKTSPRFGFVHYNSIEKEAKKEEGTKSPP